MLSIQSDQSHAPNFHTVFQWPRQALPPCLQHQLYRLSPAVECESRTVSKNCYLSLSGAGKAPPLMVFSPCFWLFSISLAFPRTIMNNQDVCGMFHHQQLPKALSMLKSDSPKAKASTQIITSSTTTSRILRIHEKALLPTGRAFYPFKRYTSNNLNCSCWWERAWFPTCTSSHLGPDSSEGLWWFQNMCDSVVVWYPSLDARMYLEFGSLFRLELRPPKP